jgi:hypothetical protein
MSVMVVRGLRCRDLKPIEVRGFDSWMVCTWSQPRFWHSAFGWIAPSMKVEQVHALPHESAASTGLRCSTCQSAVVSVCQGACVRGGELLLATEYMAGANEWTDRAKGGHVEMRHSNSSTRDHCVASSNVPPLLFSFGTHWHSVSVFFEGQATSVRRLCTFRRRVGYSVSRWRPLPRHPTRGGVVVQEGLSDGAEHRKRPRLPAFQAGRAHVRQTHRRIVVVEVDRRRRWHRRTALRAGGVYVVATDTDSPRQGRQTDTRTDGPRQGRQTDTRTDSPRQGRQTSSMVWITRTPREWGTGGVMSQLDRHHTYPSRTDHPASHRAIGFHAGGAAASRSGFLQWSVFLPVHLRAPLFLHACERSSARLSVRDVKSPNVLISKQGTAKLGDVGLSKIRAQTFISAADNNIGARRHFQCSGQSPPGGGCPTTF